MSKKKEWGDCLEELQQDGVDITPLVPSKNPFVRFGDWLSGIPRDIRHFFNEREMRKLKLGTVCFKNGMLQTINISWDIHWMSNVYIAAIIRDYLRFFIKNTCVIGNYVYAHNPEGYEFWEAQEKLDFDEMAHRWEKMLNDTADLFDGLVKWAEEGIEPEEYQRKIDEAFDALKKIYADLEW